MASLEGFIAFNPVSGFWKNKVNDADSICWDNGFVRIQDDNSENTPLTICVGVQNTKEEVRFLGTSRLGNLTSFFGFREYLHTFDSEVGLGIWYVEAEHRLYLARDLFGMMPLYYLHVPNQFVAFATSIPALIQMPALKGFFNVDKKRISSFATYRIDQSIEYDQDTFFENIKSVLPGHLLTVTSAGTSTTPFANFEVTAWNVTSSLADYGNAFREVLTNSVHRNIRNPEELLGSHLSGGLDSSSISSLIKKIAPQRPLHTFYYSTRNYKEGDNAYAKDVAAHIGSIHHEIVQSEDDLDLIQTYTALLGRPQASIISPASQATLMQLASDLGCKVLLNGSDGDSIVGSGLEMMEQLYRTKDWTLLKNLLHRRVDYFSLTDDYSGWERMSRTERERIVEQNFIYNRLSSQLKTSSLPTFYKSLQEVSAHFNISPAYMLKRVFRGLLKKLENKSIQPATLLRDDFQSSLTLDFARKHELTKNLRGNIPGSFHQEFEDVFNRNSIFLNEERFALGNYYGFRNSSPFYDKKLFELCMGIPPLIKFGDGQGRQQFREAMKGILPEHVRLRHQKATVGTYGRDVTLRLYKQSDSLLEDCPEIWEYIDKKKFADTVRFLKLEGLHINEYNRSMFHITRTISLAAWLNWLKANI